MNAWKYLPSPKFLVLVGSFFLASGLVFAANAVTGGNSRMSVVSIAPSSADDAQTSWEASLYNIQAQNGSSTVPDPIDPATIDQLNAAVDNGNLTESVGKSLLINLTNAKQQGLGDDTPTQTSIINQAVDQINSTKVSTYTMSDIHVVPDSAASQRAYGNQLMATFKAYPGADSYATLVAIGYATDNGDKTQIPKLVAIQKQYDALTRALVAVPVPQSLAPLHLLIVNDFRNMTSTYTDITQIFSDPLRSLAAIQKYNITFRRGKSVYKPRPTIAKRRYTF
jgi:hypothetical protein